MPKVKTISASQMNTYSTCPLQWYYAYILKLVQLPNPAFIIGTAYHKCLERFHKGDGNEDIINDLKKSLMSPKPSDEEIERFGLVRKMFEKYKKNPVIGKVIETEFCFKIDIPGIPVPLYGFIDRVDEDKIPEYKTSSFDYKEEDIKTIQSKTYTYAVLKQKGKLLPVVYCINNKNKVNNDNYIPQQMKVEYGMEDMKNFEEYVRNFYKEIETKTKFDPKQGIHCRWCSYGVNGTNNCKYSI
jgi:DNA helicase-2/ATP-dependent DNA helicase PcrA